jgi:hypothetical protein
VTSKIRSSIVPEGRILPVTQFKMANGELDNQQTEIRSKRDIEVEVYGFQAQKLA